MIKNLNKVFIGVINILRMVNKKIRRTTIKELEKIVKSKGLEWRKFDGE